MHVKGSLERIQEYYDHYVKRLEPLRPAKFQITNWESHIGDKTYEKRNNLKLTLLFLLNAQILECIQSSYNFSTRK